MATNSSSSMMSKEERYALMEKFLGFEPKEFLEDGMYLLVYMYISLLM